jgi:hypothetical protein
MLGTHCQPLSNRWQSGIRNQDMVHQHRIFSSLGKKMSSILFALHEPILVPPVILLDPKISPALRREKGRGFSV